MKTSLDCIPCLIRKGVEACRLASGSATASETILRDVLRWSSELDFSLPAPVLAGRIHHRIREMTGSEDPYFQIKENHNQMALQRLPALRQFIENAEDPLFMAARLSIAGNVIDMGVNGNIHEKQVRESIDVSLTDSFRGDYEAFRKAVFAAKHILYLADNTGEIAFDRLLVEQLTPALVTVAVRGGPIINDALIHDACMVGLHEKATILENGSNIPGTLLHVCSDDFKCCYQEADLVIAKGQGNYETLSEETKNIFFLLKVKCLPIAVHVGWPLGSQLLMRGQGGSS